MKTDGLARRRVSWGAALFGAAWCVGILGMMAWAGRAAGEPPARAEEGKGLTVLGTLEPGEVAEASARVAGRITRVFVDYSDVVNEGQVLAELDGEAAGIEMGRARAALARARAEVDMAQAQFELKRTRLERSKLLAQRAAVSQEELDTAMAEVRMSQAGFEIARAKVNEAEVGMTAAARQAEGTKVLAPRGGVIVGRRANLGQAVGTDPAARPLFLIAEVNRLILRVQVPEALVGRVKAGQVVRFKSDAVSKRVFEGKVTRVRMDALAVGGEGRYTVDADVANSDGTLLPYLAVTATIVTGEGK